MDELTEKIAEAQRLAQTAMKHAAEDKAGLLNIRDVALVSIATSLGVLAQVALHIQIALEALADEAVTANALAGAADDSEDFESEV